MAMLARLFDFTPGTAIISQQVDDEFNQIVNALNSTSTVTNLVVRLNDAGLPPLKLDQLGTGPIQQWSLGGVVRASIANTGQFVSLLSTGTAPLSVASTTKVNNLNADFLDGKGLLEGDVVGILQALNPIFTSAGNNAGSGDTDLHVRILSGNTLATDGAYLQVVMAGFFAANANAKRVRVLFAGTTVIDSASSTLFNALGWRVDLTIMRIDSDSVKVTAVLTTNSSLVASFATYIQINALGFGSSITIRAVGNGVSANDIVQEITTFELNSMN